MLIDFLVVTIEVLLILSIHMFNGKTFYDSLTQPNFAPPPWLFVFLMIITVLIIGYVGIIIMRYSETDKEICFSLWVAELAVLWGAFVAFFQREQIEVSAYLLVLFLAIHVSLTFKLQHTDTLSATLYLATGIWILYVILTNLELVNLN